MVLGVLYPAALGPASIPPGGASTGEEGTREKQYKHLLSNYPKEIHELHLPYDYCRLKSRQPRLQVLPSF